MRNDDLDFLKNLGRESAEPDEQSVNRARRLLEQRIGVSAAKSSPLRRRWMLAAVAVAALMAGSGLGFGITSFVTPSSSASPTVTGLGFIPAEGWSVAQATAVDQPGVARAIAASVPIATGDESRDLPYATLRALPTTGIVIVARLSPRGDEATDASFPLRKLPLRVADADPSDLSPALSGTSLVALHGRAGSGGYNVDARMFFGEQPSAATVARADQQLRQLVVAPSGITLVVLPKIIAGWSQRLTLFGSVSSGKADEKVAIQFKACGLYPVQFRDAFETTTTAGGGYSLGEQFNPGVSGVFRALSGDSVSALVPVEQRAAVYLTILRRGRFQVGVSAALPFWRRYVLLQRFERRRGIWITMRRVVLTEQLGGAPGPPQPPAGGQARTFVRVRTTPFRPAVSKGTSIRAVFPLSQAKPCYLAGYSEQRRT